MSSDLLASPQEKAQIENLSSGYPSLVLNQRQLCDLELLLNGGFSPLLGYLCRKDYQSVLENMCLSDGTIWPIPIVLDLAGELASHLRPGSRLGLRDQDATLLAVVHVEDVWKVEKNRESECVFETLDPGHPGVRYLLEHTGEYYAGGRVVGVRLPLHKDFGKLRHTPEELKRKFGEMGWQRVVAFQTRNPLHKAHVELTKRALAEIDGHLLIHPVVGITKPGDVDPQCRVRCYQHVLKYYEKGAALLSLLPLAMRMAGPREAVWHALIRKNYGCTHFIVGRDHAGPGTDEAGEPYYGPYAAQELLMRHQGECGIRVLSYQEMVYVPSENDYRPRGEITDPGDALGISGTRLREMLRNGEEIPGWFTFPEVAKELRNHPE